MEPILIFANPISGRGRGRAFAERLQKRLTADGYDVHAFFNQPGRIADADLREKAKAAIVIGGDGTLRSVAERLFHMTGSVGDEGHRIQSGPPLLIVPTGTANLMGQHLALKWSDRDLEDEVSRTISGGTIRWLDVAEANGMPFLLVAGVGIDAHIVHEVDRRRSGPITKLSYALPAWAAINRYTYPPLSVTVDGRLLLANKAAMVFVGNIREYGTGFPMLPHATAEDGLLDVCILPCRDRRDLLEHLMRAAAGEHVHGEDVIYAKGRRIQVESLQAVPVQIDGDSAGSTPLDIELLPMRLPFLVPRG